MARPITERVLQDSSNATTTPTVGAAGRSTLTTPRPAAEIRAGGRFVYLDEAPRWGSSRLVPQDTLRTLEAAMNRWFHVCTAISFALALAAPRASAQDAGPKAKDIDVVICLDVSGSMDGLIDSARTSLGKTANGRAKSRPAPTSASACIPMGTTATTRRSAGS